MPAPLAAPLVHLAAARWVLAWTLVGVVLLWLSAAGALVAGVLIGGPPGAVLLASALPAGAAIAVAAVRRAFDRQRRWAWVVLLVLGAADVVGGVLTGSPWSGGGGLLLVGLLLHPDSRSWVTPDRAPAARRGCTSSPGAP